VDLYRVILAHTKDYFSVRHVLRNTLLGSGEMMLGSTMGADFDVITALKRLKFALIPKVE
jgi:hypothetical protein